MKKNPKRFQICPEIEKACKQVRTLLKTNNLEILAEYENRFDMRTAEIIVSDCAIRTCGDENSYKPFQHVSRGQTAGKLFPKNVIAHIS